MAILRSPFCFTRRNDHLCHLRPGSVDRDPKPFSKSKMFAFHPPTSSNHSARRSPADSLDELTKNDGANYRDRTFDYYKAPRYWP
jgi:hypothetical protein